MTTLDEENFVKLSMTFTAQTTSAQVQVISPRKKVIAPYLTTSTDCGLFGRMLFWVGWINAAEESSGLWPVKDVWYSSMT